MRRIGAINYLMHRALTPSSGFHSSSVVVVFVFGFHLSARIPAGSNKAKGTIP
jgi:hypothetical protein